MASTLLSAFFGIGFWAVAARTYSVRDVGRDSALVAMLFALSGVGQLSLNNMIPRFLPQMRARIGRSILIGYGCSAVASLGAGVAFVVIAPLASSRFAFISADPVVWIMFPLSVAAWSIFCLQDAVLIALARASWLPIENGLFSAARIVVLPVTIWLAIGHGVFVAFVVPMFVTLPIINVLIARRALPRAERAQRNAAGVVESIGWRPLVRFLAQDLTGTMLGQVSMTALPLVIVTLLGTEANAYFYIPFTLIAAFDTLFLAVATSLTTETARAPERAAVLVKKAMRWLAFVQVPIAGLIALTAPLVLLPYGPAYVHHAAPLLRLLAATSPLRALVILYGGVCRVQGRGARLLLVEGLAGVSVLVGVIVIAPSDGLVGVGVAWLIVWGLGAIAVAPALRSFARRATVWGAPGPDASPTLEVQPAQQGGVDTP